MDPLAFVFTVQRGKPNSDYVYRRIAGYCTDLKDGEYRLTVAKPTARPSDPQYGWYWGHLVKECAKECGYSKDAMHEVLKARHLPKDKAQRQENGVLMGELVIGGSITKLNRGEFSEYCEEIREWAYGFLGLKLQDPDPNWRNLPDGIGEDAA